MKLTNIQSEVIPSNYFAPRAYLQSEPSTGLLSTRQGNRLLAVPSLLLDSIQKTLLLEAGEAASMAFYTFGFGWGKSFYERVRKEIELYYETSISLMNAPEFFATLQQIWGVHGLGRIIVDFSFAKEGLLLVTIENSGISTVQEASVSKSFSLEAGLLGGWFSAQTHQDLSACATDWFSQPQRTQYLIGAKPQIQQIEEKLITQGMRTTAILKKIS
ncbi:hypothetical protein [Tumidithrix helvetica]|uniref:hypothetical protein n=1 Tax=Tumidithrix helvetica TaxID=3457545 RepID=UPI003CC6D6FB